jgi:hypothetical protein
MLEVEEQTRAIERNIEEKPANQPVLIPAPSSPTQTF